MTVAFKRPSRIAQVLTAMAACLSAALAHAQVPALKIEFLQPSGQVSPTESITVAMRVTNTDASQPFSFSAAAGVAGMPASQLPTTAWSWNPTISNYEQVAFASYTDFTMQVSYSCSGTFHGPDCSAGAYPSFTFGGGEFNPSFQLGAGQSFDYTYGVLNPVSGGAPAGTYTIFSAPLDLIVHGYAADGRPLAGFVNLADVSMGQTFTRTVVAVPEPASVTLLVLGLAGVSAIARRRRRA